MSMRIAHPRRIPHALLVAAVLSAGLSGCAVSSPQTSGPLPAETSPPAASESLAASPSASTRPSESPTSTPNWDPAACPGGSIGGHSDYIEEFAFDTPEEAVLEQPRDAPPGERVQVEAGEDRQVWVVVDDSGVVVAELLPQRGADDRWRVYDYAWCWGTGGDPAEDDRDHRPKDVVEGSDGDCWLPEPGRGGFVDEVRAALDSGGDYGPFVETFGHAGYLAAAAILDEQGVVADVGVWYYDEIDVWAMDDPAASVSQFARTDAAVLEDDELADMADTARDCARTVAQSDS